MKKFIFVLAALFVFGIGLVRAEYSSTMVNGTDARLNNVFQVMYNGTSSNITANTIVILDTTNATGTDYTLGAYIQAANTTGSQYIVGVTDQAIASGTVGRVCVRGPHQVLMGATTTAGNIVTTSANTIPGYGYVQVNSGAAGTGATQGVLGIAISNAIGQTQWVYVNPVSSWR